MLFVHESVKPHCSVQKRLNGYRDAMNEAGLTTRELVRVHEADAIDAFVRGTSQPTAVICYSDLESTLLVHGLWQVGLEVPRDVSVIGFNDTFRDPVHDAALDNRWLRCCQDWRAQRAARPQGPRIG